MSELFYFLGVFALLRHLGCPDWVQMVIPIFALVFDYVLKRKEVLNQAEVEAFRLFIDKSRGQEPLEK